MASTDVREGESRSSRGGSEPAKSLGARSWRWLRAAPGLRRLYRWLSKPFDDLPPAVPGRGARVALALVAAMAVAFVIFFTAYLWSLQDAYLTHAEDLGIMDQALWNTVHGAPLHQTICNIVSDSNCLGDISRLAIHFEPIMFPISLLYLFAPSPKTLQLLQALVVATGAFPAYWLASRKLRSAFAGAVFAGAYLLFPSLEAAVTYDFHAVTLAAAFLMFALYFQLSRNNVGLVLACLLALSTKEEIVVDVAMIALATLLFQRRWRLGAGLVALSIAWLVMELAIMHAASPLGHSPTASRFAYLGRGPVQAGIYILTHPLQILQQHVLESSHLFYLRVLLAPLAYLALLSPTTLALAVPALSINLLSNDPSMYSGIYQYNAEIVPFLVLSSIQAVAYLSEAAAWAAPRLRPAMSRMGVALSQRTSRRIPTVPRFLRRRARLSSSPARAVMLALTLLLLFFSLYEQYDRGYLPLAYSFTWPRASAHSNLANSLLDLIPPDASVSAQSDLVPHVSHRRFIYMYPYHGTDADYIFLDVTGNLYPFTLGPQSYYRDVAALLGSGAYHIVAATNGYLLLAKGAGAPLSSENPYNLPNSFFSFTRLPASMPAPHPVDVAFGPALHLTGYQIKPAGRVPVNTTIVITTYWQVSAPLGGVEYPQLVFTHQNGTQDIISDFPATAWLPMTYWRPGVTYAVTSEPLFVGGADLGRLRMGVRVIDASRLNSPPVAIPPALGSGASPSAIELFQNSQAVFFDATVSK